MQVKYFKPFIIALCILLGSVIFTSAQAQTTRLPAISDTDSEENWNPPDLLNLPPDWLAKLETLELDPETVQTNIDKFIVMATERIKGLDAQNMMEAEASLVALKNNVSSLLAAIQTSPDLAQDPIPSQDNYTLEDFLALRALWRQINANLAVKQNELEQSRQQYQVLQDRVDSLVRKYMAANPSTPARVIAGLNRMASSVALLANGKSNARLEIELDQLKNRKQEIEKKLDYARNHLVLGKLSSEDFAFAISSANEALAKVAANRSALQKQLLDSISDDKSADYFLELKLKQQIALASARESLLTIDQALDGEKQNWYLLREGKLESVSKINKNKKRDGELISQLRKQSELWVAAGQTALTTPGPSPDQKKQVRYFSQAQEAARELLKVIQKIEGASDDLEQVQDLISSEVVGLQPGLGGLYTRLSLIAGSSWQQIQQIIQYKLFYIGDAPVTPGSLVEFVFIILGGFILSWFIRRMLLRLERRGEQVTQSSSFYTLGRLLHYFIMTISVLAASTSLGLDFSSLALIAGALSVGIGFGLQSIVNNFLSGLILLFEGSLRAGDFIELDSGVTGVVREISTRYTRINTNDNVDVVVPNSELVSYKLTNWTLKEPIVRVRIPFGVAYGTDKELVRKAALEAADEVPFTLKSMPGRNPDVLLVNFGDSSLDFQLRVWVTRQGVHRPIRVKASYYWALETKFREYGIKIPFPQRDVYLSKKPADPLPEEEQG